MCLRVLGCTELSMMGDLKAGSVLSVLDVSSAGLNQFPNNCRLR